MKISYLTPNDFMPDEILQVGKRPWIKPAPSDQIRTVCFWLGIEAEPSRSSVLYDN